MVLPIVEVKVTADTDQAEAGLDKFGRKLDAIPKKARPAGRGADAFSKSAGAAGASALLASNRSRMLTQQLSQVAQQTVASGNVMQAFAVQAADIGLAFGAMGTIVGAVAGLAIPTLVAAFSDAGAETRDYEEIISDAQAALEAYNEATRLANIRTGELGRQFIEVTPGATAFARALGGIAEREVLARIQEAVDLVALFGREAGQTADAVRGDVNDLAALFDVNVGLAIGRSALEARDRAREMTQAFAESQIQLEQAAGDLESQSDILRVMLRQAQELANETGGISAAEDQLIKNIAQALELVERRLDATRREEAQVFSLVDAWNTATAAGDAALAVANSLEDPVRRAANAAADFAMNLFEASKQQAQIIADAERRGGGRGGDPRTMGLGAGALPLLRMGGEFIPGAATPEGGGGGAGDGRLESLVEQLQTEQELAEQFRAEGLALLMSASEAELEALGGFNEAKLRLEEEYQERLRGIREAGADSQLSLTLGAAQDVLGAMGAFNDKALKLAKVAGAAQALVSTYQGAAEALKLPFPANLAAAAAVTAKGLGLVAAIKGVSSSGGGGGSTSAAGGAAAGAVQSQTPLQVSLAGISPSDMFSGAQVRSLLFDTLQEEAGDRGLQFVG